MEDQQTCGKGLAEHSSVPAKLGELIASLAENLEAHRKALDLKDESSRKEHDAYSKLAEEHRAIADRLRSTARRMAGYRDLPMGRHDEKAMADPKVLEAFENFVRLEQELLELLRKRLEEDRKMLTAMGGSGGDASQRDAS